MKKPEKERLVAELKAKLTGANALYYTDFTGLNVKRMTDLRRRLRKAIGHAKRRKRGQTSSVRNTSRRSRTAG